MLILSCFAMHSSGSRTRLSNTWIQALVKLKRTFWWKNKPNPLRLAPLRMQTHSCHIHGFDRTLIELLNAGGYMRNVHSRPSQDFACSLLQIPSHSCTSAPLLSSHAWLQRIASSVCDNVKLKGDVSFPCSAVVSPCSAATFCGQNDTHLEEPLNLCGVFISRQRRKAYFDNPTNRVASIKSLEDLIRRTVSNTTTAYVDCGTCLVPPFKEKLHCSTASDLVRRQPHENDLGVKRLAHE
jgi:hypothetical protein